jgi:hypothetical protein
MYPDFQNVVRPGSRGRDSNRIRSKQAFDESVVILDLEHMPYGCGTWPAFWTTSQKGPWPTGGEIDVLEVPCAFLALFRCVDNVCGTTRACTRRTKTRFPCTPFQAVPCRERDTNSRGYTVCCAIEFVADPRAYRETISTNCDAEVNNNQGCKTQDVLSTSYGEGFNSNGGGIFALERSKKDGIKVWFWPRDLTRTVPFDILNDRDGVHPEEWAIPTAYFPTGDNCDYEEYFDAHKIIFDLTFCVRRVPSPTIIERIHVFRGCQGDWAGAPSVWRGSRCSPMSCNDCRSCYCCRSGLGTDGDVVLVVDKNPERFADAYWEINSLRVYTPVGN